MILDDLLIFITKFMEMIGGSLGFVSFDFDVSIFYPVVKYLRFACWFLPMQDIIWCLTLIIALNSYQTVVKVVLFAKNIIRF